MIIYIAFFFHAIDNQQFPENWHSTLISPLLKSIELVERWYMEIT